MTAVTGTVPPEVNPAVVPPDGARRLAQAVMRARHDRGWSAIELQHAAGLSKNTLAGVEQATDRIPRTSTLTGLDAAFEVETGTSFRILTAVIEDYNEPWHIEALAQLHKLVPLINADGQRSLVDFASFLVVRRPASADAPAPPSS